MKKIKLLIVALLPITLFAKEHNLKLDKFPKLEIHSKHWVGGYPWGTPKTSDLVIYDLYALSNNDKT